MTNQNKKGFYNLILGIGGPYGAGSSSLAKELELRVNNWPGCCATVIKVSKLIEFYSKTLNNDKLEANEKSSPEKRKLFQEAGTNLRKEVSPDFVGKIIVQEIYAKGKKIEENNDDNGTNVIVFIIDSLKNTHDLSVLQKLYHDEFYFIFVHAYREHRWRRLVDYKSWKEKDRIAFEERDLIDQDEKSEIQEVADCGQQVGKLASLADYYIVNDKNRDALGDDGERFVKMLFGGSDNQPTLHEHAMNVAYSSANKSFCLSRQVGAVILDENRNILGVGHNDVPKANGGLYSNEDNIDKRCYLVGDRRCINDTNKDERFENLADTIAKKTKGDNTKSEIKKIIERSPFQQATEYCRAVHGEMEALLSVARSNTGSTVGATMYVTTQPCHNCTKHIICAGIKKVIFIEPYPKSLGVELHSDSISIEPDPSSSSNDKVCFYQYRGVAPHKYNYFFAKGMEERKDKIGYYIRKSKFDMSEKPKFTNNISPRSRNIGAQINIDFDLITSFELKNAAEVSKHLNKKRTMFLGWDNNNLN